MHGLQNTIDYRGCHRSLSVVGTIPENIASTFHGFDTHLAVREIQQSTINTFITYHSLQNISISDWSDVLYFKSELTNHQSAIKEVCKTTIKFIQSHCW